MFFEKRFSSYIFGSDPEINLNLHNLKFFNKFEENICTDIQKDKQNLNWIDLYKFKCLIGDSIDHIKLKELNKLIEEYNTNIIFN
jgi:hypothetical protein